MKILQTALNNASNSFGNTDKRIKKMVNSIK
jgi:hypothetical protein